MNYKDLDFEDEIKIAETLQSKLREIKQCTHQKNVHQATIDLIEYCDDQLYEVGDTYELKDVIDSNHYQADTLLEVVDKTLPDYAIIENVVKLFEDKEIEKLLKTL